MASGGCSFNVTSEKEHFSQPSIKSNLWLYIFMAKNGEHLCMAAGFSNTHSDCVSLFKFLNDAILGCKWEKQVQQVQAWCKATEHPVLCSDHFTEDCFEVD